MTTQIWLQKLKGGTAARESQSKSSRRLLQLACRFRGVELSPGQLTLPGPELIRLVYKDFGLGISITHCPKLAAVAVGDGLLGVDCEPLGSRRNWQGIADQFFTPDESNTIAKASTSEQARVFLRHWVLKESYIKSIGGSVFGGLNQLTLENLGKSARVEGRKVDNCHWAWLGSFAGCVLGIYCSQTSSSELTFYETADAADTSSRSCCKKVPGSFIPIDR